MRLLWRTVAEAQEIKILRRWYDWDAVSLVERSREGKARLSSLWFVTQNCESILLHLGHFLNPKENPYAKQNTSHLLEFGRTDRASV